MRKQLQIKRFKTLSTKNQLFIDGMEQVILTLEIPDYSLLLKKIMKQVYYCYRLQSLSMSHFPIVYQVPRIFL